ncbi:hypothetical protein P692DRAFT_201867603 [Suillus brevipes Sb2]|nr:hypothetical protein P692DRAFT_201867603 [Suillus brevipes Sb2]
MTVNPTSIPLLLLLPKPAPARRGWPELPRNRTLFPPLDDRVQNPQAAAYVACSAFGVKDPPPPALNDPFYLTFYLPANSLPSVPHCLLEKIHTLLS